MDESRRDRRARLADLRFAAKRLPGIGEHGLGCGMVAMGQVCARELHTDPVACGQADGSLAPCGQQRDGFAGTTGAQQELGKPQLRFGIGERNGLGAGNRLAQQLMTDESNRTQFLPFVFPWPGGSTNAITICSNGYLWFGNVTEAPDPSPTAAELHARAPRLCPLWTDLIPDANHDVHFELLPGNVGARVTWNYVPASGFSAWYFNDVAMQVTLLATGAVQIRYGRAEPYPQLPCGFSPGNGARPAAPIDLLTALPFVTGPDRLPLALAAVTPLLMGTRSILRTTEIPAGSPFGAVLIGTTRYFPGVPLDSIGMPGCERYTSGSQSILFLPTGTSADVGVNASGNPAFLGLQFACQSAVYSPEANPLQVISSNGVLLTLGNR